MDTYCLILERHFYKQHKNIFLVDVTELYIDCGGSYITTDLSKLKIIEQDEWVLLYINDITTKNAEIGGNFYFDSEILKIIPKSLLNDNNLLY